MHVTSSASGRLTRNNRIKASPSDLLFNSVNMLLTLLVTAVMAYPLYFILIASFSDPFKVYNGTVTWLPQGFTLEAYVNILRYDIIWTGYRNTIFYTVFGTFYNLALTIPAAFVLSRRQLPLHTPISWFFFITMYFGGGLIPTYMLYDQLGLLNSPLAMVLGTGVSCYNLIVSRQYFSSSIPDELQDAARIDGASDIRFFFRIALPLAAPIIAVMGLYYSVGHWNSYFSALIYLTNSRLFPLQLVLRNILILNQNAMANMSYDDDLELVASAARQAYMANSMKYALILVASAPLLGLYPFIQKYFVKGVMIGSVKG